MMKTIQTTILLTQGVTQQTNGLSPERLDCHSICGYAERVLNFLPFFLRKKINFQENILLIAFIIELNKLTLKFQI
jgi:hypothetical protein